MQPTVTALTSQLHRAPSPFASDAPRIKTKPFLPTAPTNSSKGLDAERSIAIARTVNVEEKPSDIDTCMKHFYSRFLLLFHS